MEKVRVFTVLGSYSRATDIVSLTFSIEGRAAGAPAMQKASRRRRQLSAASARASGASRKAQERKKSVCFSFSLSRHVGILKTLKNEKLSRKLEERDLIPWIRLFTYYY